MIKAAPLALALAALALATPALAQKAAADPLAQMSSDISAVLDVSSAPRVLLIESDHGVDNSRMLAVGDQYRDGWKIAAITSQRITLAKGANQRTIEVPGRARPTTLAAGPAFAAGAAGNPAAALGAFRSGNLAAPGQARALEQGAFGGRGGRGGGGRGGGRGGPGGDFQMTLPPEFAQMLSQPGMAEMINQFGALPDGSRITMGEVDGRQAIIRMGPDGRPMEVMSTDGTLRLNMDPNGGVTNLTAPPFGPAR